MWPAQQGIPLTLFHPVRDVNGAYVAGQASAVTKNLLKPDRTVDSIVVTKTDIATGWVQVTLTLPLLGEYTLELTNPGFPTADGRTEPYPILVTAGVATASNLLTSLDRVRTRMHMTKSNGTQILAPTDTHLLDTLINLVISEVSDEYQNRVGRSFAEATYTEYLDGTGRPSLVLGAGPLASVTSLESVAYADNGAGGVTETRTLIAPHTYVAAGLRTQPRYTGRGRLDLIGGALFAPGIRNYRAVYVAGFASLPEGLVGLATSDVVYRVMTRDTGHLVTQMLGDGQISYLRPQQMAEAREYGLQPYLLEAA